MVNSKQKRDFKMSNYEPIDHLTPSQRHPVTPSQSQVRHMHRDRDTDLVTVMEEGNRNNDAAASTAATLVLADEPHPQVPQSTGPGSNNNISLNNSSSNDQNQNNFILPPSELTWWPISPSPTSIFSTFLRNQFGRYWNNYYPQKVRRKHKQFLDQLVSIPPHTQSKLFISKTRKRLRSFPTSAFTLPLRWLPETNTSRMFLLLSLALIGGLFHYMWKAEAALNAPWTPDPSSRLFAQRPLPRPIESSFLLPASASTTGSSIIPQQDGGVDDDDKERGYYDGSNETDLKGNKHLKQQQLLQQGKYKGRPSHYVLPLRTQGRNIVDQNGRRFKLSSVNWYGASDELFIPGGLDVQHRSTIAATIRTLGFNSVRLPYSDEMVISNPTILPHLVSANPDLIGLRALDIFEKCVEALTDAGIAVIVNNHITTATWCCGADPCDAGWANDHLGPLCRVRQTEEEWIEHWETIMARFVDNPLVIGADLRNEVRGVWGTMPWDRWATAAERAGNALLKMNKDWLIIVGGTESGNDLTGVGKRPVKLDIENRVVYSAHVYAWSGWGSTEGRYARRSYPSFVKAMRTNWAYLVEGNEAPVWIGEFGAPNTPSTGDANYWINLLRYLKSIDADFGYWAINPRKPKDDEKESYSLVKDDWVTPVLDYRMKDMTELMRARTFYPSEAPLSEAATNANTNEVDMGTTHGSL